MAHMVCLGKFANRVKALIKVSNTEWTLTADTKGPLGWRGPYLVLFVCLSKFYLLLIVCICVSLCTGAAACGGQGIGSL